MFQLKINAFSVNSSSAGVWHKFSILQQIEMGLPDPQSDNALNLLFVVDMTLEEMKFMGLEATFRACSSRRESIPVKSAKDVESLVMPLAKLVSEWESPIGGNWIGRVPSTTENVNTFLAAMEKDCI